MIMDSKPTNLWDQLHYRLLTMGREHSTTKFLTTANPGSVYHQVHMNNMNDESFHDDGDEAIKKVASIPQTALWKDVSSTKISKEYANCKVLQNQTLVI